MAPRVPVGAVIPLDVIAGVSVATLLIPESMGMAGVAGLPPEVGLYAAPLALLGDAIFGRSTVLVVASSGRPRRSRPASWPGSMTAEVQTRR